LFSGTSGRYAWRKLSMSVQVGNTAIGFSGAHLETCSLVAVEIARTASACSKLTRDANRMSRRYRPAHHTRVCRNGASSKSPWLSTTSATLRPASPETLLAMAATKPS
jgi:hypothetical protein